LTTYYIKYIIGQVNEKIGKTGRPYDAIKILLLSKNEVPKEVKIEVIRKTDYDIWAVIMDPKKREKDR